MELLIEQIQKDLDCQDCCDQCIIYEHIYDEKDCELVIYDVLIRIYEVCGLDKYQYYAKVFDYVDHIKILKELFDRSSMSIYKINDFVDRFNINLKDNGFLLITNNIGKIQYLLDMGVDINEETPQDGFKHRETKIKQVSRRVLGDDFSNTYFKLFKFLIEKGADCKNSEFLRNISGIQYQDRQWRIDFIRYLVNNQIIDTENQLLFKDKMLYDTRLGQLIISLK